MKRETRDGVQRLKAAVQTKKDEIDSAIETVLLKENFIGGGKVGQLEEELARYVSIRHCISSANGTDALMLVLMAWGVAREMRSLCPTSPFFPPPRWSHFYGPTRYLSI